MIYLASPYSHPDPEVREERFQKACRAAARLMQEGQLVYSPIAHGHPIAKYGLPTDWKFWSEHTLHMLKACESMVVLKLEGWTTSRGVLAEIEMAVRLDMGVDWMEDKG